MGQSELWDWVVDGTNSRPIGTWNKKLSLLGQSEGKAGSGKRNIFQSLQQVISFKEELCVCFSERNFFHSFRDSLRIQSVRKQGSIAWTVLQNRAYFKHR
jgi:hypothetical protein